MRTVTDIQLQQKRKNRFSVFLDGEFAFGLDQQVLLESGIARGDALGDDQIDVIIQAEESHSARQKALRLLAVRARSEKEIRDRLHQSGYSQPAIEKTVAELFRLKLLDDGQFAQMYARNRMITRPCGNYVLRQELKHKGLNDADIEKGVQAAYEEQSEVEFARQAAIKSKRKYVKLEPEKAKKRVSDFLMRRGFHWDIARDVLEHWDEL